MGLLLPYGRRRGEDGAAPPLGAARLNNSIALFLAVVIAGLVAFDLYSYNGENMLFLGKKFLELLSWVAFWR